MASESPQGPIPHYAVTLNGAPGDLKEFSLPEAPTTGYVWRWDGHVSPADAADGAVAGRDPSVVYGHRYESQAAPGSMGGAGQRIWEVRLPDAPGSYHAVLNYERPWPGGGRLHTATLTVRVVAGEGKAM